MTIAHRFFIPHTKDLHGSRTATDDRRRPRPARRPTRRRPAASPSTATSPRRSAPGDAFSSTAVGPGRFAQRRRAQPALPADRLPRGGLRQVLRGRAAAPAAGGGPGRAAGSSRDFVAKDKSILDWLRADAGRLNARLAGPERAKLEQYLESLRSLERQIATRGTAQSVLQEAAGATGTTPAACNGQTGTNGCGQAIEQLVDISFVRAPVRPDPRQPHLVRGDGRPAHQIRLAGRSPQPPRRQPRQRHRHPAADRDLVVQHDRPAGRPAGQGARGQRHHAGQQPDHDGEHRRRRPPPRLRPPPADPARRPRRLGAAATSTTPRANTSRARPTPRSPTPSGVPTEKFGDPKYCPGPLPGLFT